MKINPDTLTLTLEQNTQPCGRCRGTGTVLAATPCPTNGRGPRGGKDGCSQCHGSKRHYTPSVTEVCPACNGINSLTADHDSLYDTVRFDEFATFVEWKVADATDTRFTDLGLALPSRGSIMTVGDYGDHKRLSDDELIASVRDDEHGRTQWVQVTRKEDLRLADAIVIVRRSNGYSVRPEWEDELVG